MDGMTINHIVSLDHGSYENMGLYYPIYIGDYHNPWAGKSLSLYKVLNTAQLAN